MQTAGTSVVGNPYTLSISERVRLILSDVSLCAEKYPLFRIHHTTPSENAPPTDRPDVRISHVRVLFLKQ